MPGRIIGSFINKIASKLLSKIKGILNDIATCALICLFFIIIYADPIKQNVTSLIRAFVRYSSNLNITGRISIIKALEVFAAIITLAVAIYTFAGIIDESSINFDLDVPNLVISQGSAKDITIPIDVENRTELDILLTLISEDGIIITPNPCTVNFKSYNECNNAYFNMRINNSVPLGNHSISCLASVGIWPPTFYRIIGKEKIERKRLLNVTVTPNRGPCIIKITPNLSTSFCEKLGSTNLWKVAAGSWVSWNASANDPDNDCLFYKYSLKPPKTGDKWIIERSWSNDSNWIWLVPNWNNDDIGEIKLDVSDGNQNNKTPNVDSEIIQCKIKCNINQKPAITGLNVNKNSPQYVGTDVTWTIDAKDPEDDPISCRFLLNGQSATSWQSQKQWTWTTKEADIGENRIEARVIDGKHASQDSSDDAKAVNFTITAPNEKPSITSFVPDKTSPQDAGSAIVWTAEASDPENDSLSYQFSLNGQPVGGWTEISAWNWRTSESDIGSHSIEAKVKDGNHNPEGDDAKTENFTLTRPNEKPSITSFVPDETSPQDAGSAIVWTAQASDPENDPLSYRFYLNDQQATDWQPAGQWTWTTKEANVGENRIEARIIDGKHAGLDGFDDNDSASFKVTLPNRKPAVSGLNISERKPPETDATVSQVTHEEFMKDIKNEGITSVDFNKVKFNNPLGEETEVWRIESNEDIDKSMSYKFEYYLLMEKLGINGNYDYTIKLYLDSNATPREVTFVKKDILTGKIDENATIPKDHSDKAISKLLLLSA